MPPPNSQGHLSLHRELPLIGGWDPPLPPQLFHLLRKYPKGTALVPKAAHEF